MNTTAGPVKMIAKYTQCHFNNTLACRGVDYLTPAADPDVISPRILKEFIIITTHHTYWHIGQQQNSSCKKATRLTDKHTLQSSGPHHTVASQMMGHLEESNILCSTQHGFRKLRSCETQLLGLLEQLTSSLNKGKQTYIIIIDFAKAFDHVNNSLLSYKLYHYGIRDETNQVFH